MQAPDERKEWVRASHTPTSGTNVTVTYQEGNLSVKWTVKSYANIKGGVDEARQYAGAALEQLKEATRAES